MKIESQNEPIITLLTDFGVRDSYTAAMKGVILSICPFAKIIDLSHEIEPHNVREGAFFLLSSAIYYPKNTIHLVVIDPGVGSERKSIIIKSENHYFVGPDNGVLSLAALKDKIQKVIEIDNHKYYLKPTSTTFHGRDIMAPIAAYLANGVPLDEFGAPLNKWVQFRLPKVTRKEDQFFAEILHIDRFGNIITNITREDFNAIQEFEREFIELSFNDHLLKIPICTAYKQVEGGEFLAIFGGGNFLEISKNQYSAADTLGLHVNDKIIIKLQ
ncbi:MAG: SAM hydrolase/SAM-dependent halogenase family protein [Candidatus Helarchaeota archaeon]